MLFLHIDDIAFLLGYLWACLKYVYTYDIYYYYYKSCIINCLCGSLAKASDTHAVGHGFEPRPDH